MFFNSGGVFKKSKNQKIKKSKNQNITQNLYKN